MYNTRSPDELLEYSTDDLADVHNRARHDQTQTIGYPGVSRFHRIGGRERFQYVYTFLCYYDNAIVLLDKVVRFGVT